MNAAPSNRLAEILAHKRAEAEALKRFEPELRKIALRRNDYRGFRSALHQPGFTTLIAEVKRASPSAGILAEDFDPVRQALAYVRGGAHALSILTDQKFFQGRLEYLLDIREQVPVPLLRKDFIVDPVQVYQTAACGADAMLLIVAALNDTELQCLFELGQMLQLDVLVEVHNLEEMDRALDLGADIIGINNRNLKTFEVNLETTAQLATEIPGDCLAISESGIHTREQVKFCHEQGIDCLLVGESLMRSPDPEQAVRRLLGLEP